MEDKKRKKDDGKREVNKGPSAKRPDGSPRPKGHVKHVQRTKPSERRTSGTQSRAEVKKNVTARIKADKPMLKGKALDSRVKGQTKAAVQRKEARGMTITSKKKK